MSLSKIVAEIRAARNSDLDVWKAAIEAGIVACAKVRQADIKPQVFPNVPLNRWAPLNECMPDFVKDADGNYTLEAWCDSEGVLDIEVPRFLLNDLADWVEGHGLRCGRELGGDADRGVLHVNLYEPHVGDVQTIHPDVADGGAGAVGI